MEFSWVGTDEVCIIIMIINKYVGNKIKCFTASVLFCLIESILNFFKYELKKKFFFTFIILSYPCSELAITTKATGLMESFKLQEAVLVYSFASLNLVGHSWRVTFKISRIIYSQVNIKLNLHEVFIF